MALPSKPRRELRGQLEEADGILDWWHALQESDLYIWWPDPDMEDDWINEEEKRIYYAQKEAHYSGSAACACGDFSRCSPCQYGNCNRCNYSYTSTNGYGGLTVELDELIVQYGMWARVYAIGR